ncbi:MAG: alkene reductase [Burkholderiales bacterium]
MNADLLFQPVDLGAIRCANRIAMAPMTRNRAGARNVPTELNALYYAQRSSAGFIVTEAAQISQQGVGYSRTPGIHTAEQIAGWKKVTQAVHEKDGKIVLQLWHVGRISHSCFQPGGRLPVAPCALTPAGKVYTPKGSVPYETPHALERSEIAGLVEGYAQATRNARAADFDGVEIHAANGYLIDQFLRDGVNRRTDVYGGEPVNRCRFLMEVAEAVADAWSADRVGVRLSPVNPFNDIADSDPPALFGIAAQELNRLRLAYLHVVESGGDRQPFDFLRLRQQFRGPYIAAGGYTRERAIDAIQTPAADVVAFATLFLANPDLPERFSKDAALNTPERKTFYGGDAKGYTDYPFLGPV